MDFCRNVSSSEYHHQNPEEVLGSLDDLFSAQNMEVDMSLEWLSVFVEDCFSSAGSCLQLSTSPTPTTNIDTKPRSSAHEGENPQTGSGYKQKFVIPVKARSKRQRLTGTKTKAALATGWAVTDPPLLQQTLWLADSELINPKEVNLSSDSGEQTRIYTVQNNSERKIGLKSEVIERGEERVIGIRKCSHCQAQKTPQWRAGPMGPKTLCNACGVRYKSGRLFPEYRPAKSPTFVSYLHSNSHKKVLEMRHATLNGS